MSTAQHRDIRSSAKSFKRDKDHSEKWANGSRPAAGVRCSFYTAESTIMGGESLGPVKVRPMNQYFSSKKTHPNKAPKPTFRVPEYDEGSAVCRLNHKAEAIVDANDHISSPLSKSLLAMLPQHANNTVPAIQIVNRDASANQQIADIIYNFDSKGPSPAEKASSVALGGLIERAEKKWLSDQTEKIIKGEYEVLDHTGETTVLRNKHKKKGSPKQKAVKNEIKVVDDDDGFELI